MSRQGTGVDGSITPSSLLLSRPRVSRLLDSSVRRYRVTTVLADPGTGKTSTLRGWAESGDHAWLSLTAEHRDPKTLLAAFVDVTKHWRADLELQLAPELTSELRESDDQAALAKVLAGSFAAAWADLGPSPRVLVLDDLDLLPAEHGITFIAALLRQLPATVRLVLSGRDELPFSASRLYADGQIGELTQQALAFDPLETQELFRLAGVDLDRQSSRRVTQACVGWASAIRLAAELASANGTDSLFSQIESGSAVQQLADTVLSGLERSTVADLAVLWVLEEQSRVLTLATRPATVRRLDALASRGLLVAITDAGWTLTALARHAVRWAEIVDDDYRVDILRLALDAVNEAGLSGADRKMVAVAALRIAVILGDRESLASVIADHGSLLVDSGAVSALVDAAGLLPVPVGIPATDAVLAQLFARLGRVRRALIHVEALNTLPTQVAWRIGVLLHAQGEFSQAEHVFARADRTAGAADLAQLHAGRAATAWARGRTELSRQLADEALELAERSRDPAALAAVWVSQALVTAAEGDREANQRAYDVALDYARQSGDLTTELRILSNRGSQLNEEGRYGEALDCLHGALRLGEAIGHSARIALARFNQGVSRLGLGQIDEALADFAVAESTWRSVDSPLASHAVSGRADAYRIRGDVVRAISTYRQAVALAEQYDDAQVLLPSLAGLARVVHTQDRAESAALIERALSQPASLGKVPAMLAAGWHSLVIHQRAEAARWAVESHQEAARRRDAAGVAEALELMALSERTPDPGDPRLAEARRLLVQMDSAVGLATHATVIARLAGDHLAEDEGWTKLRALGVRDSAVQIVGQLAVPAKQKHYTVAVQTLGLFAIVRSGTPVPPSQWQSRKARDLIKIIAGRRGRPVTREALAEMLWPEVGRSAAGNRLSVALSTLRSILDPDREFPADHFVVADRSSVRLDLNHLELDLDIFVRLATDAITAAKRGSPDAVEKLERAAAGYPGLFCAEDPYAEWAIEVREQAKSLFGEVLRRLADQLGTADPQAAIGWWSAALGEDPYDEPTHLNLVRALVASGRHGEARRHYRIYSARMSEVDVEPAGFPVAVTSR